MRLEDGVHSPPQTNNNVLQSSTPLTEGMKFATLGLIVPVMYLLPPTTPASPAVILADEEPTSGSDSPQNDPGRTHRMPPEGSVGHPISNRCSDFDLSTFDEGKACGSPFAAPCFDYNSHCISPSQTTLTLQGTGGIYVYDYDCSLGNSNSLPMEQEVLDGRHLSSFWRVAARDAGILAESYESACAFIHVNNRADQTPCAAETPLWKNGANHLMVDVTDSTRCVFCGMEKSAR